MDRFDAMEVLLAVVDAGSLSAGSRKLKAPLPSVSRKVAELERHLGTRLLVRTSRNIQLTDAGRDYVDAARQIMALIDDAELRAAGEYEAPRGVLTITAPIAFGHDHVLPLAYDFLSEHPEIRLNLLCLDRAVASLVDEHVDVGIRLGELADGSLQAVKVGEFGFVTCASTGLSQRARDIRRGPRTLPATTAWFSGRSASRAGPIDHDGLRLDVQGRTSGSVRTPPPRPLPPPYAASASSALPATRSRGELRSGALVCPVRCLREPARSRFT
jgi:DNA-binding transcriptional LysR family regulator